VFGLTPYYYPRCGRIGRNTLILLKEILEFAEKGANASPNVVIAGSEAFFVPNMPHAFKDRDVQRLIKAARAAGLDPGSVTVDLKTRRITVHGKAAHAGAVDAPAEDNAASNPWDEVLTNNAADEKRLA
jgi:hypothetical protein